MVTISDVAKLAGVSKSTVSRVLNGRALQVTVRDETRQRIEDAASKLNYRPSLFARGLKTRHANVIGVIVRDLTNPFWGGMVKGITRASAARGYHVTLSHTLNQFEEINQGALFARLGYDGILLLGEFRGDEEELAQVVADAGAVVAVARSTGSLQVPCVRTDNDGAVALAVDYLADLGHRRIAFIGGWSADALERHHAFLKHCARRQVAAALDQAFCFDNYGPLSMNAAARIARTQVRRLLSLPGPPTAVLASTEGLALGAMEGAHAVGMIVPRDFSIVGFDGQSFARAVSPSLTMVQQPIKAIGTVATNLLMDIIEDKAQMQRTIIRLPARLVKRASCGPVTVPSTLS